MKVSIIIPAYNASDTIGLVLNALNRQEYSDFEIILVDDASTDNTSECAEPFKDKLDLRIHRVEDNLGRARARNFGVEKASGEIILLLDSDIETDPTYVGTHVDLHTDSENAVGMGALKYPPDLAKRALARYYSSRGGARLKPGEPLPGKAFISCLASFRKAYFERIGGFHDGFRVYGGEDLELGLRFQKDGARLNYLPEAIGYHHHLRPVGEVVETLEAYAREGIPLVLKMHPEFASELKLDDLNRSDAKPVLWFRDLITLPLFFAPALAITNLLQNGKLPSPLISYLIFSSYRKGYKQYLRSTS